SLCSGNALPLSFVSDHPTTAPLFFSCHWVRFAHGSIRKVVVCDILLTTANRRQFSDLSTGLGSILFLSFILSLF
ncbi:hypothetical protein ACSLPA_34155, partial [Escherichia coli]